MRITADAKQAMRAKILEVAQRLFRDKGFDDAKVRDIAAEVGMATGTLFNYFASKEEVAVALAEAAIGDAEREFARKRREGASLREDLFLQVATQLRRLQGHHSVQAAGTHGRRFRARRVPRPPWDYQRLIRLFQRSRNLLRPRYRPRSTARSSQAPLLDSSRRRTPHRSGRRVHRRGRSRPCA